MANTVDPTKQLPRGAIPSTPAELAAAVPYFRDPKISAPASFLIWPAQLSFWGNDTYNNCVSAEEAFAKATVAPQTFIPSETVVDWATAHGVLNGASITAVMAMMQEDGFPLSDQKYEDGRSHPLGHVRGHASYGSRTIRL